MGYRRKQKTFVLTFPEDSELHGLEVRAKPTSVGGILDMLDLARLEDMKKISADEIRDIEGLFKAFAAKLVSWNLEDEDGTPVSLEPIEIEGVRETPAEARHRVLMEQDMDMVMALVLAWVDGMVGTPGPLDKTSNDGGQSEEGLIPMDALSSAPPS